MPLLHFTLLHGLLRESSYPSLLQKLWVPLFSLIAILSILLVVVAIPFGRDTYYDALGEKKWWAWLIGFLGAFVTGFVTFKFVTTLGLLLLWLLIALPLGFTVVGSFIVGLGELFYFFGLPIVLPVLMVVAGFVGFSIEIVKEGLEHRPVTTIVTVLALILFLVLLFYFWNYPLPSIDGALGIEEK